MRRLAYLCRAIIALLLAIAIAASCTKPPVPTPQVSYPPAATGYPAPAGATVPAAASPIPPTKVPPTAAPTLAPTPRPPLPPRVLTRLPDQGEELALDAPIKIGFDQPMDAASTEAAFDIDPDAEGSLSWESASTLVFKPATKQLAREASYRVTIAETAKSASGLALGQPYAFSFRTSGYLEAVMTVPADKSTDVETDTTIRVMFNRPVVPLVSIDDQSRLPGAILLEPPTEGTGTWVNTATFVFVPSAPLHPGVTYSATISPDLTDVSGAAEVKGFSWSFTTRPPQVVSYEPVSLAKHVSPKTAVRLTFSTAMDRADVEKRFRLREGQSTSAVAGSFSWDGNTLIFVPSAPLTRGTTYRAELTAGAASSDGRAKVQAGVSWQFAVAALPAVTAYAPRQGSTQVDLGPDIWIRFASPMNTLDFAESLVITPTVTSWVYWSDDDMVAHVSTYLRPSTLYTVTVRKGAEGRYGDKLARDTQWSFRSMPYAPSVGILSTGSVGLYNSYRDVKVYVTHRNVSSVRLALYALTSAQLVEVSTPYGWPDLGKVPENNPLRNWSLPVQAARDVRAVISTTLTMIDGKRLAPGYYYLSVSAPEAGSSEGHLLIVSPLNLTLKSNEREALVWATDLSSGKPAAGVDLRFYSASGEMIARQTTDREGIARVTYATQEPWAPLLVLGETSSAVAAVFSNWNEGISSWDYGLEAAWGQQDMRAHVFTDRSIYRPGQTVYAKGIVRADDDGRYSLPRPGTEANLVAIDSSGREFLTHKVTLSDTGTFDLALPLSENASLGFYVLRLTIGQQSWDAGFEVAEYRKPEFQVTVTLDRKDYTHGDVIRVMGESSYFFGGPVIGATVTWRAMRAAYYFDRWQGEGWYSFADMDDEAVPSFMEPISEGSATTNAEGQFVFELPADISKYKQSQVLTLEASVVDVNNQEVSARATGIVHKGDFYVGLGTDQYVGTAGKPMRVNVLSVDTSGAPRPLQALTVVFSEHEWYSVKEKAPDGRFYWANKIRETPVATTTVTTDRNGFATAEFIPQKGGTYKVIARGLDQDENLVRSALYLWVSAGEFVNWGQENNDRLKLVADRKQYRPGDTASILIPSPYQGTVSALLTIERGGTLQHRVLEITSNSEIMYLSLTADMAPNVYVSIVLVEGSARGQIASFKQGYVLLPISTEQQELRVSVAPDRKGPYRPRDAVTYQIETRDHTGKGVPAEVSLQLVDLAVQSLLGEKGVSIRDAFYRQRALGVRSAASLVRSIDRVNLTVSDGGKGGGGGGEGAMVRQVFPDTAFWAPAVQTDASGKASVTVTLPDSLTTWRMSATAVTADTRVGEASADIVTNLDLMIRPVVPRFAVIGDEPMLGAIVHNNTAANLSVQIQLQADGMRVEDVSRTVSVPAGGRTKVNWPASVGSAHEATLEFRAAAGALADAVIVRLPVYHPSSPETVGTSGQVKDVLTEWVRLPENADKVIGELSVVLEPSLAASLRDGLDYLTAYEYDCIEQTVSRFLPNVFTYRALNALGLTLPGLATKLPQQVGVGLQRLYSLQNLDGGWGWWGMQQSSPLLTAYVLLGLAEARRSDFAVSEQTISSAVAFLLNWLDRPLPDTSVHRDERAAVLYSLAEVGQGDLGRTVALYDKRDGLSLYAKAYLLMTLRILEPNEMARRTVLANNLANAAELSATGAHWQEKATAPWAMNTDTRTTAIVLRALVLESPHNPLLAQVVRWLVSARSAGHWHTTQENVWSIMALTDYMVATGELRANYTYRAAVNDVEKASGRVGADNLGEPIIVRVPVGQMLSGADNIVTLARDGEGALYYSAFLRYYLPAEEMAALSRGIYVERRYVIADDHDRTVSSASVNDIVEVQLTIIAPTDLYYVVLEDPLPAGCESLDTTLLTTRTPESPEGLAPKDKSDQDWWWFIPTHTELRDEKAALFATEIPRGAYQYTYRVRCTTPGEFKVLPTVAYEMYEPDVFGRSAGQAFSIAE